MVMPSTLVEAEVGKIGALAFSAPFGWCDVLTRKTSTIAHILKHGTSPGKSRATMRDAKLRPVPV
eukprot:7870316-Pyramimonas_sp.AAC.1